MTHARALLSLALAAVLAIGCSGASTGTDASGPVDQTAIAFAYQSSQYGRGTAIFLMAADRSGLRQIPNDSAFDSMPDWSPDGRTLLFSRSAPGTQPALWVMNADGSGVRQLSSGFGAALYGRWSPDGQSIVFLSYTPAASSIGVMRADGSDPHLVGSALVTDASGTPSWSKDGRIAFRRSSVDFPGIWTMRPDGTGLAQLTTYAGDAQPRWSPDGSRLVFESYGNTPTAATVIMVVNADGSVRRMLTDGPDQSPAWSPDGKWIIYDHHAPFGYESSCPLYAVPSAGGEAVPLLPERTRAACAGSAWRAVPAR